MLRHTLALMGKGARGSAGVGYAIRELNKAFVAAVGPTRDYGENEADEEFQRMIDGAGRLLDEGEEEGAEQRKRSFSISQEMPQHPQQSWSGDHHLPHSPANPATGRRKAVHDLGLVGEEAMAKTVYLAITSRLLDKPVSVGIKGHSASGKSYTVKTVTDFSRRGHAGVHRDEREGAGLFRRGVHAPHDHHLRGHRDAGERRGRHDELLHPHAALGGPHRLRRDRQGPQR